MIKRRLLPALPVAAAFLSGCQGYNAGGPMQSIDQYTYESYPDDPKTVTLINPTTGETLWSYDVPVGQKVVIRFKHGENKGDAVRPDIMYWDFMPLERQYEKLDNSMPVPPYWHRRVDVSLRNVPGATPPPRP